MSLKERISDFITDSNHHIKNAKTSDYKDENIKKLYICRKPVEKILLEIISKINNDFNKMLKDERYSYDNIFHLYLIIELENGIFIRTEKNPRIIFKYMETNDLDTNDYYEIKCYNFKNKCTFSEIILECQKIMGDNYDKYDSITNNCQIYVLNMIKAYFKVINIPIPEYYEKYIYLDIPKVISKISDNNIINSYSTKIAKYITDIGRKFNSLLGKGFSNIEEPISNFDIMEYLNNNVSIIKYSDLNNYKSIDDVFKNNDNVVLLYELSDVNNGHWVALRRDKNKNIIYYFDSYGDEIEDELKHASERAKNKVDLTKNKLLLKLIDSDYTIDYNNYKYQKMSKNINTCGKYCCVFIDSKMSIDEFYKYIKELCKEFNKTPDFIINEIYNNYK